MNSFNEEVFTLDRPKLSLSATLKRFNVQDAAKAKKALIWLITCLNSEDFKKFCISFNYNKEYRTGYLWWKRTRSISGMKFFDTILTNEYVYNKIIEAREILSEDEDNEADISFVLDHGWSMSAIGYGYADTEDQFTYNSFFQGAEISSLAGHLGHEWLHKLGFGHSYKWTIQREFSVPYACGNFIKLWVEEQMKSEY